MRQAFKFQFTIIIKAILGLKKKLLKDDPLNFQSHKCFVFYSTFPARLDMSTYLFIQQSQSAIPREAFLRFKWNTLDISESQYP